MARTRIGGGSVATDEDTQAEGNFSPATQTPAAPAEYEGGYHPEQYDDTSRDVLTPALQIVQGSGQLAKQFKNKAGQFVLGDFLLGTESVEAIPLGLMKYFVETHRDGKEIKFTDAKLWASRRIFASASEAAKSGYVVAFKNRAPNRVEENGRMVWLVKKPDGDVDPQVAAEFIHTAPDTSLWAVAKCSYRRGGYRNTWRRVFDAAARLAKVKGVDTNVPHHEVFANAAAWTDVWQLAAVLRENETNAWYESSAARLRPLDQAMYDWVSKEFSTQSVS